MQPPPALDNNEGKRNQNGLAAARTEEDVSSASVGLMKSGRMEMGEEDVYAAAPRRPLRFVDFLERIAVVGVPSKASRIFSEERVDVASGGAAAGSHPAQRVFYRNLGPDLNSREPKGFGTGARHDPVAMKLVEPAGDDLHVHLLGRRPWQACYFISANIRCCRHAGALVLNNGVPGSSKQR